ncbi:MAG: methyl-accepting chemotaxis protein [Thermoguttaceae bacterium]
MAIFSNLNLKKKLVAAFVAVALITCVVAAIAWWNLAVLRGKLADVSNNYLPSVRSLGEVRLSLETFKLARRAIKDPNLDLNDYRSMLDRAAMTQESNESAFKTFAAREMTPEETTSWNDFQATWADWRKANDEYFRMARGFANVFEPIVSSQVPNPGRLLNYALEASSAVRSAEVEIMNQIKAWNNLLLRGENAEEYSKYVAKMDACARQIHANIDALKAIAPKIGLEQKPITDAETVYVVMADKFSAALKELKTRNKENLRMLDDQLHGVEVPPIVSFEGLAKSVESKTTGMRELTAKLYQITNERCVPTEKKAMAALGKLIAQNVAQSDEGLKTAEKAYHSGLSMLAIGTVAGVALAIVFGVIFALSISRPLSECVGFAEAMAAGDLTGTVKVTRKDEIGQLVVALNTMGSNLRQMFAKIVKSTQGLAGAASELSSTATQLASGADETTSQSNTVATAAEEMSANMNSVAAATEQMSANVRVIASSIEELTASITEVARSSEQAANVANSAAGLANEGNARVSELGTAASEIGKVIEVIQDIAEQTSLLALNATIEAARAGDAGKGFAVVASEVKELAKQTAAATEDIRHRIEGIQTSTGLAVRSIGEITDGIKKVNEVSGTIASAVEEQSITTREIAKNVAETSTAAQTVARGVAESAAVTREIAKNIAQVDSATRHTAQGAVIAQTAGGKVAQVADELNAAVGQFKVSSTKRFDADPIKTAHALWSTKLTDMLAGRIHLDPSDVAKHTECKFGKWYHSPDSRPFTGLGVFHTIGEEHAKFHELAKRIVELHKNGRQQEAAQKLGEVRALSQNLFRLLDDLEHKANGVVAAA